MAPCGSTHRVERTPTGWHCQDCGEDWPGGAAFNQPPPVLPIKPSVVLVNGRPYVVRADGTITVGGVVYLIVIRAEVAAS